jgi:membrane-bound serine protease (ClpP class)
MRLHRPRPGSRSLTIALTAALLLLVACAPDDTRGAVHIVKADLQVNGVMDRYIDRALDHAEEHEAVAVILQIDTPGGRIDLMKEIVGRINQSKVPVVTYVAPSGAAAASAGTFITMAGHVAAMAPATTIGAATPITSTGDDIEGALGRKVTNDTVAFARGVADLRGRNADWAEAAVRDATSASATEAVELGVVDLVAADLESLLLAIEGREVLIDGEVVTLEVVGAPRVSNGLNVYERVLNLLSDPIIISLLLVAGIAGIAIEFFAPGTFLPGTAGVIALLVSFLGVGTLLPGEAAVAFLLVGAVLLVLEFFVPSGGILGTGGAVAIAIALSIVVGQTSTDLSFARLLRLTALVLGSVIVLVGGGMLFLASRYMAPTSETGTREY